MGSREIVVAFAFVELALAGLRRLDIGLAFGSHVEGENS
jgi:hypothetical protein